MTDWRLVDDQDSELVTSQGDVLGYSRDYDALGDDLDNTLVDDKGNYLEAA